MDSFNQAADKVLSARKYDILTERSIDIKEYLQELFLQLVTKILEFLAENLHWSGIPDYNSSIIFNIFVAAVVLLVLILAAIFARHFFRRKKTAKTMEEIFDELRTNNITDKDLLWDAGGLAASGNYREAVRLQFIALLWVFNLQGIISLRDYKTNNQLKREIKSSAPEFYPTFSNIVEFFNISWFGGKPISAERYQQHNKIFEHYLMEVRNYEKKA